MEAGRPPRKGIFLSFFSKMMSAVSGASARDSVENSAVIDGLKPSVVVVEPSSPYFGRKLPDAKILGGYGG